MQFSTRICVGLTHSSTNMMGSLTLTTKYLIHTVHLDASMAGMGAVFRNMVYTLPIPHGYQNLYITQLEMLNVVVALKV